MKGQWEKPKVYSIVARVHQHPPLQKLLKRVVRRISLFFIEQSLRNKCNDAKTPRKQLGFVVVRILPENRLQIYLLVGDAKTSSDLLPMAGDR